MYAVHLPTDMEEMFQSIAKKSGRTLDELVQDALGRFLVEWEDQQGALEKDLQGALEEVDQLHQEFFEVNRLQQEFKESGGRGIPWKQVRAELEKRREDRQDLDDAKKALERYKNNPDSFASMDAVLKECGLTRKELECPIP
ncbi:MAG: hypothetical protein HQL64_00420 [Magnetococcales bacterium]|nr:hypothetical protein [Magnetococcales bacterium]